MIINVGPLCYLGKSSKMVLCTKEVVTCRDKPRPLELRERVLVSIVPSADRVG